MKDPMRKSPKRKKLLGFEMSPAGYRLGIVVLIPVVLFLLFILFEYVVPRFLPANF